MGAPQQFSPKQRAELSLHGVAMPNGAYPIPDQDALKRAIAAFGRSGGKDVVKEHIIRRAKAMSATDLLPIDWAGSTAHEEIVVETHVRDLMSATEGSLAVTEGTGAPANWPVGVPYGFEVIIVKPGESANHRMYGADAIRRAVESGFWNDSKMFQDHGDKAMPRKRSIEKLVARIDTTSLGPNGEALGQGHFARPDFAAFAQEARKDIGVSIVHDFRGRRTRGSDGIVREQVDDFVTNHSVDWVAFPAAGGQITRFLPAQESEADVEWKDLTVEQLRENAPTLLDSIIASAHESDPDPVPAPTPDPEPTPDDSAVVTMAQVRIIAQEAAESAVSALNTRRAQESDTRQKVGALIGKSGLPERTRTRIVASFDGATEFIEATVSEAIEAAREELKAAGVPGPRVVGLGASATAAGAATDPKALREAAPTMSAFESAMGYSPKAGTSTAGGDA